jgi:hypothetical protein
MYFSIPLHSRISCESVQWLSTNYERRDMAKPMLPFLQLRCKQKGNTLRSMVGCRDTSVGIATSYGLRATGPGFDSWLGQEIFLYFIASRSILVVTQPPVQWVPGTVTPRGVGVGVGVKGPGCRADHPLARNTEVKTGGVIPPVPVRLHGVDNFTAFLFLLVVDWRHYRKQRSENVDVLGKYPGESVK